MEPDKSELSILKTKWLSYLKSLVDEYQNKIETDRKNFNTEFPNFLKDLTLLTKVMIYITATFPALRINHLRNLSIST